MEALSYEKKLLLEMPDEYVRELLTMAARNARRARSPEKYAKASKELDNMIGLAEAKERINKLLAYHKVREIAAARGRDLPNLSSNLCLLGNPGTAKTTVARLYARMLKEAGVLRKGTFIEAGRADLVAEYAGQTAVKVKELFQRASGGVLFIDEAYALVEDRKGGFGDEAINTMVIEMENRRDDVIVILAGYPREMKLLLENNPGLSSRICTVMSFPDYTPEELYRITDLIAANSGYTLGDGVREKLIPMYSRMMKDPRFGNGRAARNLVEEAQRNRAVSVLKLKEDQIRNEDLFILTPDDFVLPETVDAHVPVRSIGF